LNFNEGIIIENYFNNFNFSFVILPPLVSIYSIDLDNRADHRDDHGHHHSLPKSPGGVHQFPPEKKIMNFLIFNPLSINDRLHVLSLKNNYQGCLKRLFSF